MLCCDSLRDVKLHWAALGRPVGTIGGRSLAVRLLLAGVARGQRAVFWDPYAHDAQTAVLCHFDGREEVAIGDLLDTYKGRTNSYVLR